MKETFLVPVVFLLVLLVVSAVLVFSVFLYVTVSAYNPATGIPWKVILASLPARLPRLLPVIFSFSILAVSIRIHRRSGRQWVSQLLLAVISCILLVLSWDRLEPVQVYGDDTIPVSPVIIPDQISLFDDAVVYAEDRDGVLLRDLFIKDYRNTESRFTHYRTAFIVNNAIEDETGNTLVSFSTSNPVFRRLFEPPETLEGFFQDITVVSRRFHTASLKGGSFRLLVFGAFVVFCIAIQTAGRVTRWPLINICLALTFYRFFFYLYRVTMNEDIQSMLGTALSEDILQTLPEIMLLAIAAVLFMLSLLRTGKRKTVGDSDG